MSIHEQCAKQRTLAHCENVYFDLLVIPYNICIMNRCAVAAAICKVSVEVMDEGQPKRGNRSSGEDQEPVETSINHELDCETPLILQGKTSLFYYTGYYCGEVKA